MVNVYGYLREGDKKMLYIDMEKLVKTLNQDPVWKYYTDHHGNTIYSIIAKQEVKKISKKEKKEK